MLYFEENYDLAGIPLPAEIRQVRLRSLVAEFWSSKAEILEMPEPLWVRFLPRGAAIAVLFKATGAVRRRRRLIGTYAMENNSLPRLIGGEGRVPAPIVRIFALGLGLYMRLFVDRIAFASTGAEHLYTALPFVGGIDRKLVEELPSALAAEDTAVDAGSALFVGVLEPRKGVRELMSAWEQVERSEQRATLTLVGPGPLAEEVRDWVAQRPSSRCYLGQRPRQEVLALLRKSQLLVAPSIPYGRWREQIGLPIKEALSVGVTVVTTRQTGLVDWLEEHGHLIVDPPAGRAGIDALAAAITRAFAAPLGRTTVRASLPEVEGRVVSDLWLHRAAL
ncbi:glycosyl transferase family 1 [Rathayibacter sp. PhB151]|uniref:glycosyltransferase n=1 Tax=Rathayibacter sp. PhB151 TaxID=2485189 RepID=UPI0010628A01|nr:glycosyltransferase [Rathayibacter sp. PhB151]TDX78338.1 glycosyl transferase family 1 [Rathayibacter sp. PhB151]